jgi:hypothetical protein
VAIALTMAALGATGATVAAGAPVISGTDADVWNAANPIPTYEVTGSDRRERVYWQIPGVGSGNGRSPMTLRVTGIPDGTYRLLALEAFRDAPDIAERVFRVDVTRPVVAIRRPVAGSKIARGSAVLADYSCEGALSCAGPVAAGARLDTSRLGSASFSVKAVDDAGNETISAVQYTVVTAALDIKAAGLPQAINADALLPRAGVRVVGRRPVLRWPARGGARLYNVQVFRVRGRSVTKVVSAFPRRHRYRVPRNRLRFGERYVWRVWPELGGRYPARPLGLSYFDVRPRPKAR